MRMRWGQVLDGKAWHFKADAFYRLQEDGSISGHWFDLRGISLPLVGRVDGDAMLVDWGNEASAERGRSTYRLVAEALEVIDEVYGKDGTLDVFGLTRLTRQE